MENLKFDTHKLGGTENVQRWLFDRGYSWCFGKEIKDYSQFLFASSAGEITHCSSAEHYCNHSNKEITELTMNCEDKGYEIGQIFEVIVDDNLIFGKESIISLSNDDGTESPVFDLIKGRCDYTKGVKTKYGGHIFLDRVKRIYPPENTVTIPIKCECITFSLEEARAIKKALEDI